MTNKPLTWQADKKLPVGKGATKQRFMTNDGKEELAIETTPWGDGDLIADGKVVAHVEGDVSGPEAFRDLKNDVENYEDVRDDAPSVVRKSKPDCVEK